MSSLAIAFFDCFFCLDCQLAELLLEILVESSLRFDYLIALSSEVFIHMTVNRTDTELIQRLLI